MARETTPRTGWSAGTTSGGDWLTILGSHWGPPALHATAAEAEAAAPTNLHPSLAAELVVRYVRETWHPGVTGNGLAYRIVDPPAPVDVWAAQQRRNITFHRLETPTDTGAVTTGCGRLTRWLVDGETVDRGWRGPLSELDGARACARCWAEVA